MKIVASGLLLFLALLPVPAGAADADSQGAGSGDKIDDVSRFAEPEAISKSGGDGRNTAEAPRFHMESSVTFGVEMRSGTRPFAGNYGNAGRGVDFDADLSDSGR